MPFEKGETPEGAKPFQPGQSGNPNGRPRKWVNTLKNRGYKKSEVVDAIQIMIELDAKELKEIAEDETRTILEQIVASALLEAKRKKSLYNIETLLTRVYGQPKQEIETEIKFKTFDVSFKGSKKDGEQTPD